MPPAMRAILLLAVLSSALVRGTAAEPKNAAGLKSPLSPAEALKQFRIAPGLRIELVASEPDIESPVAAAFDEDGKLWVVEMRDYPNGPAKGEKPLGRIKILEDKAGKGLYKTTSVFAENLLFANGIMPWKGGVIVTAAPHILYLKDTKGTGKADHREVLYEGFAAENPQLRVSHPELGIDNWIYVANGLRGGKIQSPRDAARGLVNPINISGMDFRFDLIHDRAEPVTGMGQYGNTFDYWGNRYVCTNRNHIIPIILPNNYVKRNPYLAPPEPMRDNQGPGGAAKVFPISSNFTTASAHAGEFTSSCSVTIYQGGHLPLQYDTTAFTCEPAGNLVHCELIHDLPPKFYSYSMFKDREFLASPDDWFRPVNLFHGPEGALYVVDMYRAVIEHPQFMPPELKNRPDLLLGQDKGRIWRIVNENSVFRGKPSPLGKLKTAELLNHLDDSNIWTRMTAHRLLLEREDKSIVNTLVRLCAERKYPNSLHAFRLLDAIGVLDDKLILNPDGCGKLLIADAPRPNGAVAPKRGVYLRDGLLLPNIMPIYERLLPRSKEVQQRFLDYAAHPETNVRFQAALSLGEWDDDRIVPALAGIALRDADNKWMRAAVMTAIPNRTGKLIIALLQMEKGLTSEASPARFTLLQELTALVGARGDSSEVADILDALGKLPGKDALPWQMAALNGLAEGMGRRGVQLGIFLQSLPADRKRAAEQAGKLLTDATGVANDAKRAVPERVSAVRLLAHAAWTTAEPTLVQLIQQDPAQEIRLASVRALAAHPRAEVPALLMKSWASYTPAVRREVLEAMLGKPDRITFLLDQVEAGKVKPGDIDALRSRQLANHGNPDIRNRARKLLQENMPADRKEVLDRYKAALKLQGTVSRGKEVFQKNCTACHRIAGIGHEVGPNIADTLSKPPETLLLDILIPNAAIDNNYINYIVTTKAGKVVTGIIVAETASSVTLKRAESQTDVVLRQDIEDIQSTGMSLMPDGLEKNITMQEMADLLHFLKNWRFGENAPVRPEKK